MMLIWPMVNMSLIPLLSALSLSQFDANALEGYNMSVSVSVTPRLTSDRERNVTPEKKSVRGRMQIGVDGRVSVIICQIANY